LSATAILKLERAGFTREQVEALAEYLDDQLATKADLRELELRLEAKIAEVRHEITAESGRLRLWMVGQVFVIVGVLGTLGYFR
jgi:hypothetical protein